MGKVAALVLAAGLVAGMPLVWPGVGFAAGPATEATTPEMNDAQKALEAALDKPVRPVDFKDIIHAILVPRLNRIMPPLNFNANKLSDVVDFFRDVSHVKIDVDWATLHKYGIDPNSHVTLHLQEVPVGEALQLVFKQVCKEDEAAVFTLENGNVEIRIVGEPEKP